MAPESSRAVVVLAMDVVCDGTTDGNVLGSGKDGEEPSARHHHVQDRAERHACLAAQHAALLVEADETIEGARRQQHASFVEARIAVASSLPVRQHRNAIEARHLVAPGDWLHLLLHARVAPPGFDDSPPVDDDCRHRRPSKDCGHHAAISEQ